MRERVAGCAWVSPVSLVKGLLTYRAQKTLGGDQAFRSNQRSDMQDRPASILAISDTVSGTTCTPSRESSSTVRWQLALTKTTSLTRSALAARRSSAGATMIR